MIGSSEKLVDYGEVGGGVWDSERGDDVESGEWSGRSGREGGRVGVSEGLCYCECSQGYRCGMRGVERTGKRGYRASERLR